MNGFNFTKTFVFLLVLSTVGIWHDSAHALGKSGKSGSVSTHLGWHHSQSGTQSSNLGGRTLKLQVPQHIHNGSKIQRKQSPLANQSFQFRQRPFHPRLFLPPLTLDADDPSPTITIGNSHFPEANVEEPTRPPVSPHPLVIELRCGKFVRVPWPESGTLYSEVGQKKSCSDSH